MIIVCFSHSAQTVYSKHKSVFRMYVCKAPTATKTYMPILEKNKKQTHGWGSKHDASTPNAHNQRCHTHVKYIKLLRNSTEIKEDKKLLQPSEADGVSQYQRTTVSVFLSLCVHLIREGKLQGKRKPKRSAFPLNPRNEITNPIITWMLHGSRANRLC